LIVQIWRKGSAIKKKINKKINISIIEQNIIYGILEVGGG